MKRKQTKLNGLMCYQTLKIIFNIIYSLKSFDIKYK